MHLLVWLVWPGKSLSLFLSLAWKDSFRIPCFADMTEVTKRCDECHKLFDSALAFPEGGQEQKKQSC